MAMAGLALARIPGHDAVGHRGSSMSSQDNDVTRLLRRMVGGDRNAAHDLFPLVQAELRRLADRMMAGQDAGHTLQPTALMNEAFLRLVQQEAGAFDNREHFFAIAAKAMRSILVDHERRKRADKRNPGGDRTPLSDSLAWFTPQPLDLLALDDALTKLQRRRPVGGIRGRAAVLRRAQCVGSRQGARRHGADDRAPLARRACVVAARAGSFGSDLTP
jgi:RNA polymerase sigma-70 factor (ECF subfamily)